MQYLRRTAQILVLLTLIAIPLVYLYTVERYAKRTFSYSLASKQITDTGWLHRKALDSLDNLLRGFERPEEIYSYISGSLWSLNIMGKNVSDPLAAVSLSLAGSDYPWPFLWTVAPLVFLTLLLGRVFCGWLCPYHLLAEINGKLRALFMRFGPMPHNLILKPRLKYIIFVALLTFSFLAGISALPHIYPPAVVSREIFHYMFYGTVGFGAMFLAFLLLTELTVSERWWCRYACPGGALYSLLGAFRVVRVYRLEERCTLCAECDIACPFGLWPMSDKMGMDCDNCGLCRSACPEDALKFTLMPLWKERRIMAQRAVKAQKTGGKEDGGE